MQKLNGQGINLVPEPTVVQMDIPPPVTADPLEIPEILRVTPEEQERRRSDWKGRKLNPTVEMNFKGAAKPEDPGTAKLLAEIAAKEKTAKKHKKADRREASVIRKKKAAKPAATQESNMLAKTKTEPDAHAKGKAAKKPAAEKAPKDKPARKERVDGLLPGSKQAKMLDMVLRKTGATEAAICAELGWKKCRVTLKRVCDRVGAGLERQKNSKGEMVYFAAMPKTS